MKKCHIINHQVGWQMSNQVDIDVLLVMNIRKPIGKAKMSTILVERDTHLFIRGVWGMEFGTWTGRFCCKGKKQS